MVPVEVANLSVSMPIRAPEWIVGSRRKLGYDRISVIDPVLSLKESTETPIFWVSARRSAC